MYGQRHRYTEQEQRKQLEAYRAQSEGNYTPKRRSKSRINKSQESLACTSALDDDSLKSSSSIQSHARTKVLRVYKDLQLQQFKYQDKGTGSTRSIAEKDSNDKYHSSSRDAAKISFKRLNHSQQPTEFLTTLAASNDSPYEFPDIPQIVRLVGETQDEYKNNIFTVCRPKPGSTGQLWNKATPNTTVPQVTVQASEVDKLHQNNDRLVADTANITIERIEKTSLRCATGNNLLSSNPGTNENQQEGALVSSAKVLSSSLKSTKYHVWRRWSFS